MRLKVENGYFKYNKSEYLLKDINFGLNNSDVLSVLGPNGVGKTTLIKCIIGLLNWSKGESFLEDKKISSMKSRELWKEISYIPQKRHFIFSYSGLEMVLLGLATELSAFEKPREEDRNRAVETMKKIGICHLKDKDCNNMSGGELQMIMIARSLVKKPKVIILDEPESGLDFKNQLVIMDLIKNLAREEGVIVIINTHYPEHALSISNKCILLNYNGEHKIGNTEDILNPSNIRDAFAVNVSIEKIEISGKGYTSIIPTSIAGDRY
ncbi:ABC transporter ATP-binding protein [Peptoniphilus sp. SGI.035]|uniref:ABC transporter ATP-binding protein n=1 Tax=Peptoniphilus sp. SGI.035 TaxID=3420564 RepID=UPI003D070FA8